MNIFPTGNSHLSCPFPRSVAALKASRDFLRHCNIKNTKKIRISWIIDIFSNQILSCTGTENCYKFSLLNKKSYSIYASIPWRTYFYYRSSAFILFLSHFCEKYKKLFNKKKNCLSFIFLSFSSVLNIYVPLVNLYDRIVAHISA